MRTAGDCNTIATATLDLIHRAIGGSEQRFRIVAVRGERRDTDADGNGDRQRSGFRQSTMSTDGGSESFRDIACAGNRRTGQQRDELIATPARRDITTAQRAMQQFTDECEHGITLEVAVRIVDELELIDVNHE